MREPDAHQFAPDPASTVGRVNTQPSQPVCCPLATDQFRVSAYAAASDVAAGVVAHSNPMDGVSVKFNTDTVACGFGTVATERRT